MQRKPGFPVANCSIKMPDSISMSAQETVPCEEEGEQHQRRQQLINFGHSQWGFNNWSWTVTKQDVDFVDFTNGKYCAGVVAFVSVTVKSLDIHRENIGYSTSLANNKGLALYKSRKCAVTNALRETLLSFGGSFATKLMDILEVARAEVRNVPPDVGPENDINVANKPAEPKNLPLEKIRKDSGDSSGPTANAPPRSPHPTPAVKNVPPPAPVPPAALPAAPPVAKAHPMPANLPPAANRLAQAARGPPPPARAGSNEAADVSEEEARAERKRRQRQAQEEFRQKQLMKQKEGHGHDEKQDIKASTSIDNLLLNIPSQDIVIDESGAPHAESGKRKSPAAEGSAKRRPNVIGRLDVMKMN